MNLKGLKIGMACLLVSGVAYSADIQDPDAFGEVTMLKRSAREFCFKRALRASHPSKAQADEIREIGRLAVLDAKTHEMAIKAAVEVFLDELSQSPVDVSNALSARDSLVAESSPVFRIRTRAFIEITNILNADQRKRFGRVHSRCLKRRGARGLDALAGI